MKTQNTDDIYIEGRNTVHDALSSGREIIKIMISEHVKEDPRILEIKKLARDKQILVESVAPSRLRIGGVDNSGGVAAIIQNPVNRTIEQIIREKEEATILLFNHLDYEQNLGAIIRTSWAANIDAIVCSPSGVSNITPVVSRVSQGGAAYVPVYSRSLFPVLAFLKKEHIPIVGVEVGMGTDYTATNLLGPVAFLFGGEAAGISNPLSKYCDLFIHIPINSQTASLNVSVATALIVFEKRRQERAV